ncbi:MAG TPA: hypothetical protein VHZ31_02500 [Solirubrobacteraceae bacterium]|jgi:hypothetical protein|nr:hypothetical protein [Solirubrobacteraceae bacterium]
MGEYELRRLGEIDEVSDGRCAFRPVRLELGITSFGVNAWTGQTPGDRILNEHDELDEHEELYLVHTGRAMFELGDERVDAPAGTLVFARPGLRRTAFAEEAGTTIIAIGGTPGQAYVPEGFELWAPLRALYEAKRYAEAADRGRAVVDAHPEYPFLAYSVACCDSLAGRPADAVEHLGRAIAASERFRDYAARDSDFDPIRVDGAFRALVGEP